jgi:hypothetical protein
VLSNADKQLAILRQLAQTRGVIGGSTTLVSINVEAWECDTRETIEIGVVEVTIANAWAENSINANYYIVEEALHLRNGKYVADNRDKFNFGKSRIVRKADCNAVLTSLFANLGKTSSIYLIGHSVQQDVQWLTELGVVFPTIKTCDIAQAHYALRGVFAKRKLSSIIDEYSIEYSNLHNSGNDAVYTLVYTMRMMEEVERKRIEQEYTRYII